MSVPYTDSEASEARQWSNRYGPPNAWTASLGTAARMIGRLLDERERLMAKQTVAEYLAWVAQNAAIVKASKEGLRDHFAAAALTGLLASREWPIDSDEAAHYCYRVADAMLRERGRTNHDAAPAARAPEPEPSAARRRPAGGTGDTVHGASPEARASAGRPRTDNADLPICAGTGDTPVAEPATTAEPVAWGVANGSNPQAPADELASLRLAIRRLAEQDATLSVCDGNVTVTMDATLTDAERAAIETAMNAYGSDNANPECAAIEETLWRLLERMR